MINHLLQRFLSVRPAICAGAVLASCWVPQAIQAEVLWYSRFEQDAGRPVSHNEPAFEIESLDSFGLPNQDVQLTYVAYADPSVDPFPAQLGGPAVAGDFAISYPDDPAAAINSQLPSDSGDLFDAFTFEGFFNTFEQEEIVDQTFVGRRLVTQKRSGLDGQSRMAIGLHGDGLGANVLAVYWNDGANNLGLGTTLIEPDRWYHFAMVYDGDIRWFLNGELEGMVEDPLVVDPGTAFIGIGNNRTGIETGGRAFRGLLDEIRILDEALEPTGFLIGGAEPVLQAGDADMDMDFDQLDLVQVQIAAKYLSGQPATWGEGDWDGAPGGSPGDPPIGNGLFDQLDIIAALAAGTYLTGPYAASSYASGNGAASMVRNGFELGGLPNAIPAVGVAAWSPTDIDTVVAPVPEPSALGLLAVGLALGMWGRNRRSFLTDLLTCEAAAGDGPRDVQAVAPQNHASQSVLAYRVQSWYRLAAFVQHPHLEIDGRAPLGRGEVGLQGPQQHPTIAVERVVQSLSTERIGLSLPNGGVELLHGFQDGLARQPSSCRDGPERRALDGHVGSQAQIVGDVGVGDLGRGRDEMRPAAVAFDQALIEQQKGDFVRLTGHCDFPRGRVGFVAEPLAVPVQQDRALLQDRVFWMLPGDQQPLDHPMNRRVWDQGHETAHQFHSHPSRRQQLLETISRGRDETKFGPVGDRHVDHTRSGLLGQPMAVAGRKRIDPLDHRKLWTSKASDHVGCIGIIARGQHDRAAGPHHARLVSRPSHHAGDSAAIAQQFDHRGVADNGTAATQQMRLQGRNVRLGVGNDIVHPRNTIGRFRAGTVKGQAQVRQPLQRVGRVPQKEASQLAVVLRLVIGGPKLRGVLLVVFRVVPDARLALQRRAAGRKGSDGQAGGPAQLGLFLQQQDIGAMLGGAGCAGQPAAATAHHNHVVLVVHGRSHVLWFSS
jgi:hypothetical protein